MTCVNLHRFCHSASKAKREADKLQKQKDALSQKLNTVLTDCVNINKQLHETDKQLVKAKEQFDITNVRNYDYVLFF